jgi:hypothetical protein
MTCLQLPDVEMGGRWGLTARWLEPPPSAGAREESISSDGGNGEVGVSREVACKSLAVTGAAVEFKICLDPGAIVSVPSSADLSSRMAIVPSPRSSSWEFW